MGKTYRQLSLEERCTIACLQEDGQTIRQIATVVDRAASTVSREIKRNTGTGAKAVYRPAYADELAWSRRWQGSKLERQPDLQVLVLDRLAMGWSPEQVAGRLACEQGKMVISHESIYRFIYAQIRRTNDFSWRLYLPRAKFKRGYRGHGGGASQLHIKHRIPIGKRPASVDKRHQMGHWEADLMMFSNKKDNLLVAQERVSRFIFIALQTDKKADRIAGNLANWFAPLPPQMRRTFTQDNGTEFAKHHHLNNDPGMKTFFCDPRSPWQKGGVENANGRLRRFLPTKIKVDEITDQEIELIADICNNTPRKCLGFKTPAEIFQKQLLHFKCESTSRAVLARFSLLAKSRITGFGQGVDYCYFQVE
jgi:transposase, IS30 family